MNQTYENLLSFRCVTHLYGWIFLSAFTEANFGIPAKHQALKKSVQRRNYIYSSLQ